jgi:hypothetical protein
VSLKLNQLCVLGGIINSRLKGPESFIGWISEDGLLDVVDIYGKQGKTTTFKVICHKCKEDKELFPLGYFVSTKSNLRSGRKPCGCSARPKWDSKQTLVLLNRKGLNKFKVLSIDEEIVNQRSRLKFECLVDGFKWETSVVCIMKGSGCPQCAGNARKTPEEAYEICRQICAKEGYTTIGFMAGYKNKESRFEYCCPRHDNQNVTYANFVNHGCRCPECYRERMVESGELFGYYKNRKDEKDFLYVLDFDSKFIKVGRSFNIKRRVGKSELQKLSGFSNIKVVRVFTGNHKEVWDTEQELLALLKEKNLQYSVSWTTETFRNECLTLLNNLLDCCELEELVDY